MTDKLQDLLELLFATKNTYKNIFILFLSQTSSVSSSTQISIDLNMTTLLTTSREVRQLAVEASVGDVELCCICRAVSSSNQNS